MGETRREEKNGYHIAQNTFQFDRHFRGLLELRLPRLGIYAVLPNAQGRVAVQLSRDFKDLRP
eukprot:scaffold311_cov173-Amphora_coffeaeformis.AAC.10